MNKSNKANCYAHVPLTLSTDDFVVVSKNGALLPAAGGGEAASTNASSRTSAYARKRALPALGGCWDGVKSLLPILEWLPRYSARECLHSDLVAGLTVGIMAVPQALGYATIAKLDPVYGLYTCLFSAFFYMFLGGSRHISIGTFAVASMMVGALRAELIPDPIIVQQMKNETMVEVEVPFPGPYDLGADVSPIALTSALTFGVGVMQLLMYTFRLSFLTTYISDTVVSGFTTGAAVHVLTAQLDKVFGIRIKKSHSGPGVLLFMLQDIVSELPNANPATVCLSVIGLVMLAIGREVIGPRVLARWRIPFPTELILAIVSIVASTQLQLRDRFGVRIVEHVPKGVPFPSLPCVELLRYTWMDCFSIAVVCFVFVLSMGKIFAKKHRYRVDSDKELRALGLTTVLTSLFPVQPFGCSLSRSAVCEMTGAKTQLHAFFTCCLLFVVVLWMSPLLEPLPMTVLAVIVIISLTSLFRQFRILPVLWTINRFDFATWVIAFSTTVCLNIVWGLTIPVLSVLIFNVLCEQWPRFHRLNMMQRSSRSLPSAGGLESGCSELTPPSATELSMAPIIPHHQTLNEDDVTAQIWRWEAPLHFANAARFSERMTDLLHQMSSKAPSTPLKRLLVIPKTNAKIAQNGGGANSSKYQSISSLSTAQIASRTSYSDAQEMVDECKQALKEADDNENLYSDPTPIESERYLEKSPTNLPLLVLEASGITHVDSMGVEALAAALSDAKREGVVLRYAAFSDSVLMVLDKCEQMMRDGRNKNLIRRYLVPREHCFASVDEALHKGSISEER